MTVLCPIRLCCASPAGRRLANEKRHRTCVWCTQHTPSIRIAILAMSARVSSLNARQATPTHFRCGIQSLISCVLVCLSWAYLIGVSRILAWHRSRAPCWRLIGKVTAVVRATIVRPSRSPSGLNRGIPGRSAAGACQANAWSPLSVCQPTRRCPYPPLWPSRVLQPSSLQRSPRQLPRQEQRFLLSEPLLACWACISTMISIDLLPRLSTVQHTHCHRPLLRNVPC